MPRLPRVVLVALVAIARPAAAQDAPRPAPIDFDRDVRPILSDRCFRCHGPDGARRKAGLRLDRRDDAVAGRDGVPAVVPGKPDESEAFARITSDDPDERMPPPDSGLALSPREVDVLRAWIGQGAEYRPHWAFVPPRPSTPPEVGRRDWPRNAIDRFVLAGLERRGLSPSPEAPRAVLLRRVTLDLTGLPPTPGELDAFEADRAPDAYERAVDRLLASPRLGERLALDWLDAARYADSSGYYTDAERRAWPWRDWVIDAFNANMPFDRFTVEQLAGDLLPGATALQRIATGFNRNHMVTNETGVIEEECRVGYVVDRVDTTATVWLGLTVGCARCHDHKFDPVTQEEYYRLFAYFNNVPESGLVKDPSAPAPVLALPTAEEERTLADLRARRSAYEARLRAREPGLEDAIAAWEATALSAIPQAPAGPAAHFPLDRDGDDRGPGLLEASTVGALAFGPGVRGAAATFDATQHVEFDGACVPSPSSPFSMAVWVKPGRASTTCLVSKMASTGDARGFEVLWAKSAPRVHLVHDWGHGAVEVSARQTFPAGEWHHLAVTYDGLGKAAGVTIYVDGRSVPLAVRRDDLSGPVDTDEPWRIAWKGAGVGLEGSLDELRLYDRVLDPREVDALYWRDMLEGTIATPKGQRTRQQAERLRTYYVARHAPDDLRRLSDELATLRGEEDAARKAIVAAPVMAEMSPPRPTHVLARGQYDRPGKAVAPGVPAALGAMPAGLPANRLGLARWLVAPDNPLTARVAVNRYWQLVFGEGLVRTPNDFGVQGEPPTHPELLDWLAGELVRSGWDIKSLMRLMVTSAVYRQSSAFTRELLARDPENRLLARGGRHRLPAELIRDQALAIGGLLVERAGGPSVRPYQPAGLWEAVSYNGDQSYAQDHGPALYRRGLYTFWKRQAPPPALLAFDGPTRETCTVRRPRTNTPLQALVLLNDVTYVEAARGLARRMIAAGGADPAACVRHGFRAATGRLPADDEVASLVGLYRRQLAANRDRPQAAAALLRSGESPRDASADPCTLAAWTAAAGVLLNLDETITRH